MLPRMKLLPLYGLVLFGLVQCVLAKTVLVGSPQQELIVAPQPDDEEEEEEYDPANDPEIKEYGLVLNQLNICGNITNNSFLPHVGNCSSYIDCLDEEPAVGTCYTDSLISELCNGNLNDCELGFDYTYQTCNHKTYVKCMPQCMKMNLTSFCYDRTCTKYVLCYYGIPVLRECQDGLQYNAETDRCDFPQYVDCVDNECSAEITPRDIIYLASRARCDKYYICSDGKAFSQECGNGLYYNPDTKGCDIQSKVDCKITAEQRNIKPFSRSPPRRADIICPEKGIHFYAHKTRRDAYYYCAQGNGVTLDCTPGLFYDPETRECREPQYIFS